MTSQPIATKFNLMIRQWTLTFMPAASDAIGARNGQGAICNRQKRGGHPGNTLKTNT
jgi:hypothetical protein